MAEQSEAARNGITVATRWAREYVALCRFCPWEGDPRRMHLSAELDHYEHRDAAHADLLQTLTASSPEGS